MNNDDVLNYKTPENYQGLDSQLSNDDSFESIIHDQEVLSEIIKREPWRDEWKEMPEFVQDDNPPYAKMMIRFRNENDLNAFSKLIDQNITSGTKSLWYPVLERGVNSLFEYVDDDFDDES